VAGHCYEGRPSLLRISIPFSPPDQPKADPLPRRPTAETRRQAVARPLEGKDEDEEDCTLANPFMRWPKMRKRRACPQRA
jgi:1-acyl-sn-glycerol-3-phosphate acyltransferase